MRKNLAAITPTPSLTIPSSGRFFQRWVLQYLNKLQRCHIVLHDDTGKYHLGDADQELHATIRIHDMHAYQRLVFSGGTGAAEGYMAGEWSCDDLTAVVRIFSLNWTLLYDLERRGPARLTTWLLRAIHALRRNTRSGSRANIAAHYDLGNDFYELFLDETLMYSSAIFPRPDADLHEASLHKLERICRKLDLQPTDHVLEIGTGWGGFALYAAQHYGCRVTTTTISKAQFDLASARVRQAGLADRVTVLLSDYRDLEGQYDKLVSIEMIEAVGHQYFPTYFNACSRLLKEDGLMVLQTITLADQDYEFGKRSVDFIKNYIFPGGCLPSPMAISQALAKAADLRVFHLEDIGPHYATTLKHWRERFLANRDRIRALGFNDEFMRLWEYYFCYCEGGFMERAIGAMQIVLTKPLCRREPLLTI
ncbi:MAG: cyclopropane-fatty-acyl-phospholipid synthase family protein [Candidatus Competibacteraceae bacterium]|jgi:cyclopropane-fatty-acyl-phospholipid synthase|nr:cyclopropane-fatty-acyl-phospholipid synthase family protein [Candidatus Competibacteraceae bacterium]